MSESLVPESVPHAERDEDMESPSVALLQHVLLHHADAAAHRARQKMGGVLSGETLAVFLNDPECLRYPTEIVFDDTDLEPHQFAQPFLVEEEGSRRCILRVRPRYAACPEVLPYFVAYMAAVINYGDAAWADLCEIYGATLLGLDQETFYRRLCHCVDHGMPPDTEGAGSGGCCCGGGRCG
jgi:hypothetical protein